MIETTVVNGRRASVGYFTDDWKPADKDVATMAKVIFLDQDGDVGSMFLRLRPPPIKMRKARQSPRASLTNERKMSAPRRGAV
jgi:hypothetical protein